MDIAEWKRLQQDWISAQSALAAARAYIDSQAESALGARGAPPRRKDLEALNDLVFLESEARGRVDQFLSEIAE